MYIRNREDALDAVAGILDLPDRAAQIVRSSVSIMLCLDAEPRELLGDCQRLLLENGLEALRTRRQDVLDSMDQLPLIVLDPEGDLLFRGAAEALDALDLTKAVRQVFPELRVERWILARALLRDEEGVRELLRAAIRARTRPDERAAARRRLQDALAAARPAWIDRAGSIRAACLDVIKGAGLADVDVLHEDADRLFEIFAVSDERAAALLEAGPEDVVRQVARLHEAADAVRALRAEPGAKAA